MKLHSGLARNLCLLLIFILVTGCGRTSAPANSSAAPTPTRQVQSNAPVPGISTVTPSKTRTPAMTATMLPRLDRPLIWYLRGNAPADLPRVNERLNRELAMRGFGAEVELRVLPPGDFDQRVGDKAGEIFDIVSLTENSYIKMLDKQGLLPLDKYPNPATGRPENLLETYASGTVAHLPPAVWAAWISAGGSVYAIPNQSEWVRPFSVSIRADVVQALSLQASLDAAQTFQDLTPVFAKIQAAIRDGTLQSSGVANAGEIETVFGTADILRPEVAGYDPLAYPLVVRYDDPSRVVRNWFAAGEFKVLAELRRAWQAAGYGPSETLTPDEIAEGYQNGQFVAAVGSITSSQRYGYEWIVKSLSPDFISAGAVAGSVVGISAGIADQPERVHRAVRLVELMHTDPKLYNLLAFGIEGDHWNRVDRDKGIIRLIPGSRYRPNYTDQIGDAGLAYGIDGQASAVLETNTSAPVSVGVGFVFHPIRVAGESAAIKGLLPEWFDPLSNGAVENMDGYITRMVEDLDAAGLSEIEAELLEQMKAGK